MAVLQRCAFRIAITLAIVGLAAPVVADEKFQKILMRVENEGTIREKVVEFTINPEVKDRLATMRSFVSERGLSQMTNSQIVSNREAMEKAAATEGWDTFNLGFGTGGAVGTVAENVLEMGGLKNVNSAMTNLGLFMTVWQVNIDLCSGDIQSAGRNAYKGILGYAIGTWGSSALQVGNVATFVIDVALQEFGKGAWLARTDAWRQVYTKYYREREANAEAGEYGVQPLWTESKEKKLERVKGQTEGGRTINEWKFLLDYYRQKAHSSAGFEALVQTEVQRYVGRFWDSDDFQVESRNIDSGSWGFGRGASLTVEIKENLEAEHRAKLMAVLVKKVFPEIARRQWYRSLEGVVRDLNDKTRLELNDVIRIDVGAFDLVAPAKIVLKKPNGGEWTGSLQPNKPRTLQITKLAMLKAGWPTEISLELPEGTQTRPLVPINDIAVISFGEPVTPMITVYDRKESAQSCTVTTILLNGERTVRTETRAAVTGDLDIASYPIGEPPNFSISLVMGDFNGDDWVAASPGAVGYGGSGFYFTAPRYEDIQRITACEGGLLVGGSLAKADCTVERRIDSEDAKGTRIETLCTSKITIEPKGVYATVGEQMKYIPLDGDVGKDLRNVLIQGMSKTQGNN
ncbi:hypothetical protein [Antarcticimicrobium sediminis]|uniref:Uncharacterized protein n=1 Tax=Antarcticimicrobium sediminis TaxID=2546227 RepID=A0A4R5EST2_9RHOB|nr:hypothetical protein [Antarcticimicrobium sediminis]TDE37951.1 hypothetical protein E1B25_11040 [Antarcticimicrobium sediminis]